VLTIAARLPAGFSSLSFMFVAFFVAYGMIATLGAVAGSVVFLTPPYRTDIFLAHYGLACGGLALGLCALKSTEPNHAELAAKPAFDGRALFLTAILFAGLATLFEAVNMVRAGGLELVMSGKALYQGAVTDLSGTLPTEFMARAALAMLALWVSVSRAKSQVLSTRRILSVVLVMSPVLALYLYHGRRTEILALLMIGWVAVTWHRPLRRLTVRLVLAVALAYLGFAVVLILRETVFSAVAGRMTMDTLATVARYAIVPSHGEFGAPFAVFSETLKRAGDVALLWGSSYLDGFALVIPSFLYPGEKPVQLDAAFFATMFAKGQIRPGGIAGYGYSPLLEAYRNFGSPGVAAVYFVVGAGLAFLERQRPGTRAFPVALFYLMALPIGQVFHRSTFGNAVLSPGLWIVATVVLATMVYGLLARRGAAAASGRA
jgi:hypothetical protein